MKNEFDEYANDYRRIHTKNIKGISGADSDFFTEYKIKELADRKLLGNKPSILDYGCGDGNSARFMTAYFPEANYCGIDISANSIRQAVESCAEAYEEGKMPKGNYRFLTYGGRRLPFEDNTFDMVYIACVMHHIIPYSRIAVIRECMRVLKNGGKLVVFEHNPLNPLTLHAVNTCPFDENAKLLTASELCKIISRAGGWIEDKRYTFFVPRKGVLNKITGIEKNLSWCPLGGQYYVVAVKETNFKEC